MAAMIEIRGLTKRFGAITAVDDVSFSIEKGEFHPPVQHVLRHDLGWITLFRALVRESK